MSRDLGDCEPELQEMLIGLLHEAKRALPSGDAAIIAQTFRSATDQLAAWRCGRDENDNIVDKKLVKTYAKPGTSQHNVVDSTGKPRSRAADILILRHGRVVDDGKDPSYAILGAIGRKLGLEWSGDWKNSFEAAHFQLPKETA